MEMVRVNENVCAQRRDLQAEVEMLHKCVLFCCLALF